VDAILAAFDPRAFRWGASSAPWHETLVLVLVIAAMAAATCVLIFLHLRQRTRRPKRVTDQWQVLSTMGELCPRGWQAQITLYGQGAPVPADAPPARTPLVELEWKHFDEHSGRGGMARRMWARTIGGALQAMVDDRRTDVTPARSGRRAAPTAARAGRPRPPRTWRSRG